MAQVHSEQELKDLITDIHQIESKFNKTKKKQFTEEEWIDRIRDWTTFYRRNLDVYVTDYLKIKKIAYLQRQMLCTMSDNSQSMIICSREMGKKKTRFTSYCLD